MYIKAGSLFSGNNTRDLLKCINSYPPFARIFIEGNKNPNFEKGTVFKFMCILTYTLFQNIVLDKPYNLRYQTSKGLIYFQYNGLV